MQPQKFAWCSLPFSIFIWTQKPITSFVRSNPLVIILSMRILYVGQPLKNFISFIRWNNQSRSLVNKDGSYNWLWLWLSLYSGRPFRYWRVFRHLSYLDLWSISDAKQELGWVAHICNCWFDSNRWLSCPDPARQTGDCSILCQKLGRYCSPCDLALVSLSDHQEN